MNPRIIGILIYALVLPVWGADPIVPGSKKDVVRYAVDPVHSYVGFGVKHMLISTVRGEFSQFKGWVEVGKTNPLRALSGEVEIKSLSTRNSKRDGHLVSGDFFNAKKFPKMSFRSLEIKNGEGGAFILTGDLKLRGVSQKVIFTGQIASPITDPWGHKRLGLTLEAEIDRTQFGMTWSKLLDSGGLVVGKKVKINLELEAVRKP
jgi:polyisoprenoid-binding protein YceI